MGTIVPAETHKGKFAYVENQSVKSLFTATQTRVDDEAHQIDNLQQSLGLLSTATSMGVYSTGDSPDKYTLPANVSLRNMLQHLASKIDREAHLVDNLQAMVGGSPLWRRRV